MTGKAIVLALNLGIAFLGVATSALERPATPSAPARSVLSHRWDDLPEPATETVWCAREDAVYAACGDHDRLRTELLH